MPGKTLESVSSYSLEYIIGIDIVLGPQQLC